MSSKLEDFAECPAPENITTVELPLNQVKETLELAEKFEEDDDVQNVYHNLEMTDKLIKELEKE